MALKITVFVLVMVLMLGIAFGFYRTIPPSTPTMVPAAIKTVTLGTTTIAVEVAATDTAREQGLSGRTGLAPNSGMLFIFDTPGTVGFWMKDMLFSIDMLFLDANGTVVTLDADLSPHSYNAQNPQSSKVFYPRLPVSYVLEVPAGFAAEHGIVVGSQATFN